MKKKKTKPSYCRHRDVIFDMCPHCGWEIGYCEKCDDEVMRSPSKKLAEKASF